MEENRTDLNGKDDCEEYSHDDQEMWQLEGMEQQSGHGDRGPNMTGYIGLLLLIGGIFIRDSGLSRSLIIAALILGIFGFIINVRQKFISFILITASAVVIASSMIGFGGYQGQGAVGDFAGMFQTEDREETTDDMTVYEEELSAEEVDAGIEYETEEETEEEAEEIVENLNELVTLTDWLTERDLVIICGNNAEVPVNIEIKAVFYDAEGEMINVGEASMYYCAAGHRDVAVIGLPKNTNYDFVDFDHYEFRYSVTAAYENEAYTYYGDELIIDSNVGANGGVLMNVQNPTGIDFDSVVYYCIFYNQGSVVGVRQDVSTGLSSAGDVLDIGYPVDKAYKAVSFDDYEIIVANTMNYT